METYKGGEEGSQAQVPFLVVAEPVTPDAPLMGRVTAAPDTSLLARVKRGPEPGASGVTGSATTCSVAEDEEQAEILDRPWLLAFMARVKRGPEPVIPLLRPCKSPYALNGKHKANVV
jgi:hypothetical protein